MAPPSVHPMVVGRSDALCIGAIWCANWAKWENLSGTGWTDEVKTSIGTFNVLCSRDDVKCGVAMPSAPVEPAVHRSIPSVQWRQLKKEVQRLVQMLWVTGLTDTQSSVKPMVPQTVRQKLNGYFRSESDRMNRRHPIQRHRFNRWFADFSYPLE